MEKKCMSDLEVGDSIIRKEDSSEWVVTEITKKVDPKTLAITTLVIGKNKESGVERLMLNSSDSDYIISTDFKKECVIR